ncbi:phosphatase PAP2 family protein [Chryseosolibacter indicus]|uniref:Phosphatase PAP2 family protein n=1 Tax=Chryseosolibacter indicus TaxID=2782351 RepID=A0ABS5VXD9_9BACT|nr:phosphatase PAP2 family protein [Chryseosolibacter indicus]MBT1706074.1 phosphatase PAP2 family protein [Chryseosolibacter indicus]
MRRLIFIALITAGHVTSAQISSTEKIDLGFSQIEPKREKKQSSFLQAVKVPTMLIGLGVYSCASNDVVNRYEIREERNEHLPNFKYSADNYLMHAPIAIVYGLNLAGVKGKNDFKNRSLLLLKSEAIMAALTFSFKEMTNVSRPDGSDGFSFPSGHTAQAFATATFMAKEYGDESHWYSIGAYGIATTVGAMRILNNRHWISDVFAGAGIGILSTNLAYLTHRYKWKNKNSNLTLVPAYTSGPALYVSYRLN